MLSDGKITDFLVDRQILQIFHQHTQRTQGQSKNFLIPVSSPKKSCFTSADIVVCYISSNIVSANSVLTSFPNNSMLLSISSTKMLEIAINATLGILRWGEGLVLVDNFRQQFFQAILQCG